MVIRTEKNRIKALIIDTITLLCKNGLTSKMGFSLDGVIGVTSLDDEDDVFLIPIKEMIKHEFEKSTSESDLETHSSMSLQNKRKRKRRRSKVNSDNDGYGDIFTSLPDTVKQEEASDSDTDLVMVKEEPAKAMHLQATQLPLNESSLINDAVSMAALSPIQTYHASSGWSPQMPQHFGSHQAPPQLPGLRPKYNEEDFTRYSSEDMKAVAKRIAATEGMFLTVRLVKRRVSRYPTAFIIKTMQQFMTRPKSDPLYMGEYREPPRTKVFYKCPPELISNEALAFLVISRQLYTEMYQSVPKIQKWDKPEISGRLLLSVLEASPFGYQFHTEAIQEYVANYAQNVTASTDRETTLNATASSVDLKDGCDEETTSKGADALTSLHRMTENMDRTVANEHERSQNSYIKNHDT